jgi:ABC-2 type transport system ATP-binding protein
LIDAENLTKKFGGITAVDGLTFHVNEGEVFGFLGPNGAGKTTTVRILCCLISKTGGQARVGGYEIGNDLNSLKIRSIIGFLPDNVGLYEELSAYKNLDMGEEGLASWNLLQRNEAKDCPSPRAGT